MGEDRGKGDEVREDTGGPAVAESEEEEEGEAFDGRNADARIPVMRRAAGEERAGQPQISSATTWPPLG